MHVGSGGRYVSRLCLITLHRLRSEDLVGAGSGDRLSGVARLQIGVTLLGEEHILIEIIHHLLTHSVQTLKDILVVRIGPNFSLFTVVHIASFSLNLQLFLFVNLLLLHLLHSLLIADLGFIEGDQVFGVDV